MVPIDKLKPAFQGWLRPAVATLARYCVTANEVIVMAIALSLAAGAALALWPQARWPLFLLAVVLALRVVLNAVDGMLTREHDMTTRVGTVLSELGDVVSELALFLPLALVPGVPGWAVVSVVLLGVLAEFAGVVAVQIGAPRRYDGPLGKSERALGFGLIALGVGLGVLSANITEAILIAMLVLGLVTVMNRVRRALGNPLT